jgi:hypothetical protein
MTYKTTLSEQSRAKQVTRTGLIVRSCCGLRGTGTVVNELSVYPSDLGEARWDSGKSWWKIMAIGGNTASIRCQGSGSCLQPSFRALFSHLPRVSTTASTFQLQKGRDPAPPTPDVFIQVLSIAKDACGIPPAQVEMNYASSKKFASVSHPVSRRSPRVANVWRSPHCQWMLCAISSTASVVMADGLTSSMTFSSVWIFTLSP